MAANSTWKWAAIAGGTAVAIFIAVYFAVRAANSESAKQAEADRLAARADQLYAEVEQLMIRTNAIPEDAEYQSPAWLEHEMLMKQIFAKMNEVKAILEQNPELINHPTLKRHNLSRPTSGSPTP